jgi:hypothetical protein
LLGGSKSFAGCPVRLLNIFFVNNNSTGLPDYMIINVLHILVINTYRYSTIYIDIYIIKHIVYSESICGSSRR